MNASTCLGTKLVKRLLKRGYTVHATIQDRGKIAFSIIYYSLRLKLSDVILFYTISEDIVLIRIGF